MLLKRQRFYLSILFFYKMRRYIGLVQIEQDGRALFVLLRYTHEYLENQKKKKQEQTEKKLVRDERTVFGDRFVTRRRSAHSTL